MYINFQYDYPDTELMGYFWEAKNPVKVMCIIHGKGEYAARYDRLASYMVEGGISVISMDLPGHGISGGSRGHIGARAQVLNIITLMIDKAQEMYPDLPIILYGHSMGGNLCLDYRMRGPKNGVPEKYIVSAPWIILVNDVPKPVFRILHAISGILPKLKINSTINEEFLGNLENTRGYNTDPLVEKAISLKTAADAMDVAASLRENRHPNNKRAKGKPFLLMHGDADKVCSVEGSRKLASIYKNEENFKYIEWEGYYHEIHNGGPEVSGDEVIKTIRDFALE